MYIHIYIYTYIHIYIYTYRHIYIYTCIHMCVCVDFYVNQKMWQKKGKSTTHTKTKWNTSPHFHPWNKMEKMFFKCLFLHGSNSRLPPLAMAQVRAGHVVPWLRLLQGPKGFKCHNGSCNPLIFEGPFRWWLQTRWHEFVPTWVPGEILRQPWPLQARSWVPAIPTQQFLTYWILLDPHPLNLVF